MEHLKERNGIKIQGDQDIFGTSVKSGTEVLIKSLATYKGEKCHLWAPEYHSILLDSAIRDSLEAEKIRSQLQYGTNPISGNAELSEVPENFTNTVRVLQLSMGCLIACISSFESWVNKTISSEVLKPLDFKRDNNELVTWGAARIEKDASLTEKLFHVIPTINGSKIIEPHVRSRKRFSELVRDRNTIIHLKASPRIENVNTKRINLVLKILKQNTFLATKNAIQIFEDIHFRSKLEIPYWLAGNIGIMEAGEHQMEASRR